MDKPRVYDLGEIKRPPPRPPAAARGTPGRAASFRPPAAAAGPPTRRVRSAPERRARRAPPPPEPLSTHLTASLALLVPGAGHIVCGWPRIGLALIAAAGLAVALARAILYDPASFGEALASAGLPAPLAVWLLAAAAGAVALLQLGSVATLPRVGRLPPPAPVTAAASTLLPGWGQLLAGCRVRAALFLAGAWTAGAAWLLASPFGAGLLSRFSLALPPGLVLLTSPPVLWGLPALVWPLAVYDAAATATIRRL